MKLFYNSKQIGGGTDNYNYLYNQPAINDVTLVGKQTTEGLGITWFGTQSEYDAIAVKNPNTIYIIDDGSSTVLPTNYNDLTNKPTINGYTVSGNKVSTDYNVYSVDEVNKLIATARTVIVSTSKPASPVPNTIYYVGPDGSGIYHIYMYDNALQEIDLGTTAAPTYTGGDGINVNALSKIITFKPGTHLAIEAGGNVGVETLKVTTPTAMANTDDIVAASTVYNALPKINGSKAYDANFDIYPPTTAGSEGEYWRADGVGQGEWTMPVNNATATTLGTSDNLVTEKAVKNGLPKINGNQDYNADSNFYVPSTEGSNGQFWQADGTLEGKWVDLFDNFYVESASNLTTIAASRYANVNVSAPGARAGYKALFPINWEITNANDVTAHPIECKKDYMVVKLHNLGATAATFNVTVHWLFIRSNG